MPIREILRAFLLSESARKIYYIMIIIYREAAATPWCIFFLLYDYNMGAGRDKAVIIFLKSKLVTFLTVL